MRPTNLPQIRKNVAPNYYGMRDRHTTAFEAPATFMAKNFKKFFAAAAIFIIAIFALSAFIIFNTFFGAATTSHGCLVQDKPVLVSDGESIPAVSTTCGLFTMTNYNQWNAVLVGNTYTIEHSESFLGAPGMVRSMR